MESSKVEMIKKTKELVKKTPNMPNYEQAYKGMNWKDHEKDIAWFDDGKINIALSVDRHALGPRKDKIAYYYVGPTGEKKQMTFLELYKHSNKFANVLKNIGIKRGDRVFIFLPRNLEVYVSFLGTLKMGGIASTLFSAFGPSALKDRLENSEAIAIVTTPDLKLRVDEVRKELPNLKHIILIGATAPVEGTVSYEKEMEKASDQFKVERMDRDEPAFMLYTSGTTGKPKGVIHTHYAVIQQMLTTKWVLDLKDDDIYWCTADHGWITGISYGIIGPLANGITSAVFEGRFSADAWYQVLRDYKVSVWYTAPTAIRMLMKEGDEIVKKYDLSSLRSIYSVGEPLNPEAIRWGMKVFRLPFHDNWWQTETGAMLIANYPCMDVKLGSMGRPFPGVVAGIVDDSGNELGPNQEGNLAIRPGWPAMMRTIWKNKEKYDSYFMHGWYIPGDRAMKDSEGYFWFVGRADDVIKTSGERVGPFEVESALIDHPAVAEAGVIGKPDELRGAIVKAFITLNKGYEPSDQLKKEIQDFVKKRMAFHAYPREIEFVDSLPKTRSGKIMRRVLKAKEMGLPVGDTSTLEND
ncbi:MAG: acetate--CoA ligase [Candidatus Micrarchaeota archaeon]|nr:acetate--CoA ligase [Candidatus Micrarchaeota archaeon]